jgi:hypothetical protein
MTTESLVMGRETSRADFGEEWRDAQVSRATTGVGSALRRLGRAWLQAQVRVAGPPWDGGLTSRRQSSRAPSRQPEGA